MNNALQNGYLCPAVSCAFAITVNADCGIISALAELDKVGQNVAHRIIDSIEHISKVNHISFDYVEVFDNVNRAIGRRGLKSESIRTQPAEDSICTRIAIKNIISNTSVQKVATIAAADNIVSAAAMNIIGTVPSVQRVVAVFADNCIITGSAGNRIASRRSPSPIQVRCQISDKAVIEFDRFYTVTAA